MYSFYLSIYLSNYLSIYLSIYLTVYLFLYIYLFVHIYLTIYLSIYLYVSPSVYLSIYLSSWVYEERGGEDKPPPARLMHDTPSANSFNFIFSNYYKPKNLQLWNVFFGLTSVPAWYHNYQSKIKLDPISIGLFYPIWIGGN